MAETTIASLERRLRDAEGQAELFRGAYGREQLRVRQLAILFGIPDGAQYINDAIERARQLGLGDESELRERVKEMEE